MLRDSTPKVTKHSPVNALLPWATMGFGAAAEYTADFWQRSLLFLDILRRSGNQQAEMTSRPINAVAIYDYEMVLGGDSLPRPVNYALVRVVPPAGTVIDDTKAPVVVIDPRAGQGPGIGGFKPVSEIGQAFQAKHPVYFIGFTVDPLPRPFRSRRSPRR